MKRIFISTLVLSSLLLASCSSDEDPTEEVTVTAPDTYTFLRDGETSVSFSGQTTRIAMAEELVSALVKSESTEAQLDGMFTNTGDYFSDADLNTSTKVIRSKVAASNDFYAANTTDATAIKEEFDSWINEQVTDVFPNYELDAVAGTAGQLQESGGGSTRYVNEKGVELNQVFAKGLIGGLMADQMLNNYLGTAVLDGDSFINVQDNDLDELADDSNYTTMEHKWDEAYGYLYGAEANTAVPVLGADSFLNKYLSRVEGDADFAGIADDIYNAFKLGRAAIVAKDYDLRNEQAEIIREKVSEVIGVRAVYYLQAGKGLLEASSIDYASAFHDLSEGLGFVYSLQFTRKPNSTESYFTKAEVDGFMADLLDTGNGLWEADTADTLETISNTIAAKFNFTVAEAAN